MANNGQKDARMDRLKVEGPCEDNNGGLDFGSGMYCWDGWMERCGCRLSFYHREGERGVETIIE